jgi:hypothetical protein
MYNTGVVCSGKFRSRRIGSWIAAFSERLGLSDNTYICRPLTVNQCDAWLPDGIFSYQKSPFGYILEGPGTENVDIFYGRFIYFMTISVPFLTILMSFGISFSFW